MNLWQPVKKQVYKGVKRNKMGYYRHEVIIIMGHNEKHINMAWEEAATVFENKLLTPIILGTRENHQTFFIAPDGSELGWDEQVAREKQREKFIEWLKGSGLYLWWTHVCVHDDFGIPRILGSKFNDTVQN